ncbi:nuclear transport factor 2 family protein [Teredinibacter franksiae]|jgi:Uncharacterized conserved protein (DUF2358).|uniref:nuclear transport factor 2 family protein n=1 Tax=Teredinibacter franksiae TaxID=2761453 RepID=UPI00162826E4|nr:nuclear transport factor 2 family protein [Teredinibacter franksiae]
MSGVTTDKLNNDCTDEPPAVVQFKNFYRELVTVKLDEMGSLYDEDVIFRDPVHQIRGVNSLHAYMSSVSQNLNYCRFEYLDQLVAESTAYIKWNMYFSHPKLTQRHLVVRGISHIEFGQRIHYHEDIYDLGEMLYENVPLVGLATRWLKRRLAKEVG